MARSRSAMILAFTAFACLLFTGCKFIEEINNLMIDDIKPAHVKDGEYTGTQNVFPVTATVVVSVKAGRITAIKLTEHGHGPGHGAEAILDRVIAAQSLTVDAVSGSTYSSKVVRKAIELALKQGL
jgi:uncharacterized protein with FMN-binding domain